MMTVRGRSLPIILPQRLIERPHFLRGFIKSERDRDSTEPHISFEVPDSRNLTNELETDTEDLENTSLDEFV